MKKRCFCQILVSVVAGVLLTSTAHAQGATQVAPASVEAPRKGPVKPSWQVKWDELVREARKEGVLSVYATSIGPEEKAALQQGMKDKFGVTLDMLVMPQASFVAKLNLERRAGIFSTDVWVSGPSTLVTMLKPQGLIDPLDDVLILPEVIDKKNWRSHSGVFFDKDHMIIGGFAEPSQPILVNTKMVSPKEIKGLKDLLDPKWKKKIIMPDCSVVGIAAATTQILNYMGEDYMRALARQEPTLTRKGKDLVELVVRKKFPISLGAKTSQLLKFYQAGAKDLIKEIWPEEAIGSGTGGHSMALINKAPHPNAAKLFLNWTQTREGQTLMAQHSKTASRRVDINNEWSEAFSALKPGTVIIETTEESLANFDKYAKTFGDIFLKSAK